jgi:1-deoxy-D-xylulose-5-phosphate reductoisomerase
MPIQYALTYPERDMAPVPRMNWAERREWQFMPPDLEKFPLLRLAYEAQEAGRSATCTLNAADEVAVSAFLEGRIRFTEIYNIVAETLDRVAAQEHHTIDQVLETDRHSRVVAAECVARRAGSLTLQETERLVKA